VITIAPASDLEIVRELFTEYAASLGVDLSFQDFDSELSTLDDFYELILVAHDDDNAAGCVALRRLDDTICEMKAYTFAPTFAATTSAADSRNESSTKRVKPAMRVCASTHCRA